MRLLKKHDKITDMREKNKSVMKLIHDTLILILYVDLYII